MKALRGLKKQKTTKILDPQKVAEQKLAIFSEEPFINPHEDASEPWTISSFNITTPGFHNDLTNSAKKSEIQKSKKSKLEILQNSINRIYPSISEELTTHNSLNKYFRIYEGQQSKNQDYFFHEKKSLSLTNYIMLDKRKPHHFIEEKNIKSKHELQRLKMMHLKKSLLSRKNKRNQRSFQKMNLLEEKKSNLTSKANLTSYSNYFSLKYRQSPLDEAHKIKVSRQETGDFLQNYILKQSMIKRKKLSSMSMRKYFKKYEFAKQILEKEKQISSWVNSTKIKLHSFYQKYTY